VLTAQPGAFEDRPRVMEAHPGAIEDSNGALEAHHGAVEACPGAMESLSRAVEAHMESILAQMGPFGTIGSHPDEDYSMRSSPEWACMAPMWTYIAPLRASMAPGLSCTCEDVPL
jgi:hypothetical protein